MDMRAFQADDQTGCLSVFDSNRPEFFFEDEREPFAAFLAAGPDSYWVLEHDGAIVGCGGYVIDNPDRATLRWFMVRRDVHRNGLGRFLLFALMKKISASADPTLLSLNTTTLAAPFFERQGFRSGGANGMLIEMVKKLKVCN